MQHTRKLSKTIPIKLCRSCLNFICRVTWQRRTDLGGLIYADFPNYGEHQKQNCCCTVPFIPETSAVTYLSCLDCRTLAVFDCIGHTSALDVDQSDNSNCMLLERYLGAIGGTVCAACLLRSHMVVFSPSFKQAGYHGGSRGTEKPASDAADHKVHEHLSQPAVTMCLPFSLAH